MPSALAYVTDASALAYVTDGRTFTTPPSAAEPATLTLLHVFEDGVILHCAIHDCGGMAYTIMGGDALCWKHYDERPKP